MLGQPEAANMTAVKAKKRPRRALRAERGPFSADQQYERLCRLALTCLAPCLDLA